MGTLRLFVGMFYDLGRVMASFAAIAAIGYLAKGMVTDNPSDGETALICAIVSLGAWLFARIFRRYAI